uniref:PH domain-containing protein n=1 Tax=Theropithecus gelada TaxID=9565 RepID=A0A8D2JZL7_THEGE
MAFVKSGWLLRQSTILKRWKKNWFDLWSDGHLIYYDDQTRQNIEDKVHMPVDCINIRKGQECRDIQPPDGKSKDCMLQIVCRDGKTISLCAESTDDCFWAWCGQENCLNLGGRDCGEPRSRHCTPAWVTERDSISKKKKKKKARTLENK